MVRAKLIYLALLIGLIVFYVLYIDSLPLMMLGAALILPIIFKACLLVLHRSATAELSCQAVSCCAGDTVPITITVQNPSCLFFPCAEAVVRISHSFGKGRETIRLRFPVQDHNSTRLTFYVGAQSCGTLTATLRRVWVFDPFRLFHTRLRGQVQELELLVLPKPVQLSLETSAAPVENSESVRFEDRPGDDPSELFGVREYHEGDPVSRIHWKLSSRSDTLYLKEFGAPVDKHALLLLEYRSPARQQQALEDADALLTLLYSLAHQLIRAAHPVTLAWFDKERGEVVLCSPSTPGELTDAFGTLYDSLHTIGSDARSFLDALGAQPFSSAHVVTNCPDTAMLGILEHSIAANHRTLLIISEEETPLTSEMTDIMPIRSSAFETPRIIV